MNCDKCKQYGLDPKKVEFFKRKGILGKGEGDETLRRAAMLSWLEEIGLDEEEIVRWLSPGAEKKEQMRILRRLRSALLDELHDVQKRIDKTDCLLYALSSEK